MAKLVRRFLFTTFEGGGHVPPPMIVARRLKDLGHEVLVISDACNAAAARAKSLPFRSWMRAPVRGGDGQIDDSLDDWRTRWPPSVLRRLCDGVITGPAEAYARDVIDIAEEFRPDVIVSNELLFGSIMAAECLGVPVALLTANPWCFPTRADVPPFGPGFSPANNESERTRDRLTRAVIARLFDAGLPDLNAARERLGLGPLAHTLDQLRTVDQVMLGTSGAFEFGVEHPPAGFAYVGPLFETPEWAGATPDLPLNSDRPNVLVSFSTTYQDQKPVLARAMKALAALPVTGIVTLGPAVSADGLPKAVNLIVLGAASHDVLVPLCSAVVCHGGHGTLMRPLMNGVPVVSLPMGRDHADNAARLAWAGAGIRLNEHSSARAIGRAVAAVLAEPSYAAAARRLGAAVKATADGGRTAAEHLLSLAETRQRRAA